MVNFRSEDTVIFSGLTPDITDMAVFYDALEMFIKKKQEIDSTDRFNYIIFEEIKPNYLEEFTFDSNDLLTALKALESKNTHTGIADGIYGAVPLFIGVFKTIGNKAFRLLIIIDYKSSKIPEFQIPILIELIEKMEVLSLFIDIIGLNISDPQEIKVCKTITEKTNGKFYNIDDVNKLEEIFTTLSAKKELDALDASRSNVIIPEENQMFYENLAQTPIYLDLKSPEQCSICFKKDTKGLVQCPTCKTITHEKCWASWAKRSNLGILNVFRCHICYNLIRISINVILEELLGITPALFHAPLIEDTAPLEKVTVIAPAPVEKPPEPEIVELKPLEVEALKESAAIVTEKPLETKPVEMKPLKVKGAKKTVVKVEAKIQRKPVAKVKPVPIKKPTVKVKPEVKIPAKAKPVIQKKPAIKAKKPAPSKTVNLSQVKSAVNNFIAESYKANKKINREGTIKAVKKSLSQAEGDSKWNNDIWRFAIDISQDISIESAVETYVIRLFEANQMITKSNFIKAVKGSIRMKESNTEKDDYIWSLALKYTKRIQEKAPESKKPKGVTKVSKQESIKAATKKFISESYHANKKITKSGTITAVKQTLGFSIANIKWDNEIWNHARDITQEVMFESAIETYLAKVKETGRKVTRTTALKIVKTLLDIDLNNKEQDDYIWSLAQKLSKKK